MRRRALAAVRSGLRCADLRLPGVTWVPFLRRCRRHSGGAETCEVTGPDRKTVMTHLKKGLYPNAWQDTPGRKGWNIPATDLVAAGDLQGATGAFMSA